MKEIETEEFTGNWTDCGVCPKCEEDISDYGVTEFVDDILVYLFSCSKCGFKGREVYLLDFLHMTNEDGIKEL